AAKQRAQVKTARAEAARLEHMKRNGYLEAFHPAHGSARAARAKLPPKPAQAGFRVFEPAHSAGFPSSGPAPDPPKLRFAMRKHPPGLIYLEGPWNMTWRQ